MKKLLIAAISVLTVMICSCGPKETAKDDYIVAAYIWPSCHDDSLAHAYLWPDGEGEWEIIRKGNPRFEGHYQPKRPLWGYEMDDDPVVVEKWIRTALDHGVNTFVYDWYWFMDYPFLEGALNDGFLKAPSNKDMNFYIMWANHDVVYNYWNCHRYGDNRDLLFDPDVNWDQFKVIVDRIIRQYFCQPNYLKFDGRPIMSIFSVENLARGFGSLEEAGKAVEYFRSEAKKAGYPDIYFMETFGGAPYVSDEFKAHQAEKISKVGIDAVSFYNMGGFDCDYEKHCTNGETIRDQWDGTFGIPVYPCVSIGWDDTPRYPKKQRDKVTQTNHSPEVFERHLRKAKEYADNHPDQPKLININAWNEWVEGSYLLPDEVTGFGYLEAVRNVFGKSVKAKGDAADCKECKTEPAGSKRECVIAPYGTYAEGLIGDIRPKGWIEEFLKRQVSGLTGHPEAMCYPFNSCLWAGEITRETEEHGDDWWRYEQTGYYSDGLLRLGYLLDDETLVAKGEDGIRYTMSHLTEDGSYGFRERMCGGKTMNVQKAIADGEWLLIWPQAVYFRALQAYYEANGDMAVPKMLEKHFLNFKGANIGSTRNIVNVEGLTWTYARTGNEKLLTLAQEGWKDGHFELNEQVCLQDEPLYMHGVSCCEELKVPMLLYAYTGDRHYLDLALRVEQKLEDEHMLPDGIPSSAEHLAGKTANHSHETCDISDFTWSMGYYLMTTGEAKWGDKIERAVFNAGPGAIGKDFKSLQYFSSVNQFAATGTSNNNEFMHGKSWMEYRPVHETECCAGNVHRFMPDYVARMWLQSGADGIVAALYGPSEIDFKLSDGSVCTITEETAYPFGDSIDFRFKFSKRGRHNLSFSFRIPEWAKDTEVRLNGKSVEYELKPGGFGVITRKFSGRDRISVSFGCDIEVRDLDGQGSYVERGPLLYTYSIPTKTEEDTVTYAHLNGKVSGNPDFKCWSKTADGPWNYALVNGGEMKMERTGSTAYPYDEPTQTISVPVKRVKGWELQEGIYTPENPASFETEGEETRINLVPYGTTYLRLTVFPVTD